VRRLGLVSLVGGALLALGGCASEGYGSGGGFDDFDDCYDGYCVGYNAYGRVYERPRQPTLAARGDIDRIDRSHGTTTTVSRGGAIRSAGSSASIRMPAAPSTPSRPAPSTVSRR
jgi:hypothetical protein